MSAAEAVAVALSVLVAVLAGVLVSTLVSLTRLLREVRDAIEQLRADTLPLVDELDAAVRDSVDHVVRAERLITAAEGLEHQVDAAARLAYRTIQSPVVKAMAIGAGVSEAGKRLRGKAQEPAPLRDGRRGRRSARADRRARAERNPR